MKKIAVFAMVLMFAFGAFATTSSAQYCQFCCYVIVAGNTMSCGGFYVPDVKVTMHGDLGYKLYPNNVTWSDGQGAFSFLAQVPLGNYWNNYLVGYVAWEIGGKSTLYYYGESSSFEVNCAAIGQVVQVWRDIPMWVI